MKKKTFLSIDELIKNIEKKNILIKDKNKVKKILETNNYYFIMGYKYAFKDEKNNYRENTSFEDIYSLYVLDKLLKLIILNPILEIEQKLKTVYTNNYSSRYGFKSKDVLNKNNYDIYNAYLNNTLFNLEKQLNNFGSNNKAVIFYKNKYNFVPLWVYMKILSFGMIRDLFYVSKSNDKEYIKKKLTTDNISNSEVTNMLRLLVRVRNICCHDDILISFVDEKLGIKNTKYHNSFKLKMDKDGNIIQGKKDLFAILICIKFFIDKRQFNKLIDSLSSLFNKYSKNIGSLSKSQLLFIAHLPNNFEKLKKM